MMARKRRRRAALYTFFLVLFAIALLAAAAYGLLMVWTYAEEYEYTRSYHAIDDYLEELNRERWSDGIAEAVAAMPHEAQTDEEIKAFVQDKLSSGVTAVRKGGSETMSVYSLRCGGREIGTVTIEEDTSYRSRIDTTQKPWSWLKWNLYPWKVTGDSFDFNALYNSVEVTVPFNYQVFVNGVQLGSEYIVEKGIPYDNINKEYYSYWNGLPTKVTYRFDHIIGEAQTEIRDGDGQPTVIDPNQGDEQFTTYVSGDELARYTDFAVPFATAYLSYISGAGDPGVRLAELKNYMLEDGTLYNRMYDALDGLSWAHTSYINVDSVFVNSVLELVNGFSEVDLTASASYYYYGKGDQTSTSNLKILVYDDGERLLAEGVELY
ncbi:MAG: hypothetical protein K6F56_02980 [Oscillospiraceae bacterium]|nr:hypothetical protein [Oscillospiraceae bacterium]